MYFFILFFIFFEKGYAMGNIAIRVEHLSKMYKLGVINNGTLWKDMQTWAALKMGKEDPHSKIGEDRYSGDEDHFWALKDVSFDIQQGDRVGIIGKNGAGKSTLLKLLSRVTSPTEGVIKIKGKISSLLEVGTGFNGELTGRENIYLNGAILGMKTRQIDRKLDEIIAFSEIEHHIDTPVKRYSSGMYVRLAFAVAAHLDSDILIADEVLAVGDAAFQKKALGKMNDLSTGEGRTVLFVSHQMNAVKTLCNKGIVLEKGRIVLNSSITDAISLYSGQNLEVRNEKLQFVFPNRLSFFNVLNIISYELCDENNTILEYNIYDTGNLNVYLQISGEILTIDKNLVIFLTIRDSNNNEIMTTDIFESGEIKPEDLLQGLFKIRLSVPVHLLNQGEYSISVSSVIHCKGWIIEPDTNKLFFSLFKKNKVHPVYEDNQYPLTGNNTRTGILRLNLHTELFQ
jgi:lipopolysaccharide transport system ATP-binding protein